MTRPPARRTRQPSRDREQTQPRPQTRATMTVQAPYRRLRSPTDAGRADTCAMPGKGQLQSVRSRRLRTASLVPVCVDGLRCSAGRTASTPPHTAACWLPGPSRSRSWPVVSITLLGGPGGPVHGYRRGWWPRDQRMGAVPPGCGSSCTRTLRHAAIPTIPARLAHTTSLVTATSSHRRSRLMRA